MSLCDWSSDVCSSDLVVRAAEQARECEEQRKKSQFSKAVDAARKALAIEPNLPAAHICIATVYEAQHMPLDSLLAAYQRAAKGDSLNATAWENIARSEEHTSELQSHSDLVCRLLLE